MIDPMNPRPASQAKIQRQSEEIHRLRERNRHLTLIIQAALNGWPGWHADAAQAIKEGMTDE